MKLQRRMISSKIVGGKYLKAEITRKKGKAILSDPINNKGLGFPRAERDRLSIRGLLPSQVLDVEDQEANIMREFNQGWAVRAAQEPEDEIINSGVNPDDIRKWTVLQGVHDRNQTLYYRLLMDNFSLMSPIIYTPTVGWACSHFSHLYRRGRGMYFCRHDRNEMASMVYNWDSDDVDAVVVTDGSRVLGLGDLGVGGLAISMGKLDLYVAAGGFHPRRVLPVVIDVGTNNSKLKDDPRYLGDRADRLEGEEYYSLIDEFMAAIKLRWPKALIQFEDFQSKHAVKLLARYKREYLMFNDDIQGTAATVLAGLYGAMRVKGEELKDQTIVVAGAGSACSGVVLTIRNALNKRHGVALDDMNFFIVDAKGLITKGRSNLKEMEEQFYDLSNVVSPDTGLEGLSLLETVRAVKPNILVGLSACGGLFSQEVIRAMKENEPSPIIFPLSNPTSRSECSAEEAQAATEGTAIFASGSPFPDVVISGKTVASSQCNNRYIFPGLALGAALGQTGVVTNAMINRAAEALVELINDDDLRMKATFPRNVEIREIAAHIAGRVFEQAVEEKLKVGNKVMLDHYEQGGLEEVKEYIYSKMWYPNYKPLVYVPPGKGD